MQAGLRGDLFKFLMSIELILILIIGQQMKTLHILFDQNQIPCTAESAFF